MTKDLYLKAYTQQRSNAKQRGIEVVLTFEEWKQIWLDSGKWDERGRGADKYCMCRIGDKGAYSVGNVFIGQGKHNVRDGNIGKLDSEETKRKKSQAAKGKSHDYAKGINNVMHRPEAKAKLSEAISGSKHYRARAVQTPFGMFLSGIEASKALNVPKPTVYWKCKYQKDGWSFLAIA